MCQTLCRVLGMQRWVRHSSCTKITNKPYLGWPSHRDFFVTGGYCLLSGMLWIKAIWGQFVLTLLFLKLFANSRLSTEPYDAKWLIVVHWEEERILVVVKICCVCYFKSVPLGNSFPSYYLWVLSPGLLIKLLEGIHSGILIEWVYFLYPGHQVQPAKNIRGLNLFS